MKMSDEAETLAFYRTMKGSELLRLHMAFEADLVNASEIGKLFCQGRLELIDRVLNERQVGGVGDSQT